MRWLRALALVATGLIGATDACGQVRSVEFRTPRPFGYFLGDTLRHDIEAVVEKPYTLGTASLPRAGALTYWLDLRDITIDVADEGDATRYRIGLDYQTFYAPLATRTLEVPSIRLIFADGDRATERTVPVWPFVVSPLRELEARVERPEDYLRADMQPRLRPAGNEAWAAAGLAAVAAAALAGLLHHAAAWPFHQRPARPFTRTARLLARDGLTYRERLLALHAAFDRTDGGAVLADDVPAFVGRHPSFVPYTAEIAGFFDASRQAFYGDQIEQASDRLNDAALRALAAKLGRAERGEA
ncbi:nonribosomal peptide synthetase MxaA [Marinivivus vitaminiproducens]|uniref:nonribosomal peptide synthetase MxaA n=1 Tax=Marinivivus vitaminiproducens TaxID=3035935 RepID=UPI0027A3B5BA|nr:hypothetical protein P4R82_10795 [Geminicoccaceae bacterium SCSIO 64248]